MIIILIIVIILMAITMIWSVATLAALIFSRGVPFVSLTSAQLRLINEHIKVKPSDSLADLGCGDGRVLRLFEKQGLTVAEGYEINYWACLKGWVKNFVLRSKSKIYFKNFHQIDLAKYDIIFLFLLDNALKRLKDKLKRELKPGAKIISFGFSFPDWTPSQIIYTNKKKPELNRILIYQI